MVYAKKMNGDAVEMLFTYDYQPEFTEESGIVRITESEYRELMASLQWEEAESSDSDEISDAEALAIITGEVEIDDEE